MSTTAVRSPAEFEEQLQRYLYERSEEGRAVRVGEKEVSEQAAIVARFSDLFSRDQLRALRDEEARADEDQREWLYRLRKTCESGLIAAELAEKDDELENEILAARVDFKGEELPLRSALATLAIISDYSERDALGEIRERKPGVPVVLLTGSVGSPGLEGVDADAVISKPFTLDELTGTLGRLVLLGGSAAG